MAFWQSGGDIVAQLEMQHKIENARVQFKIDADAVVFQRVECIVEPVAWYASSNHIVACVPEYC